MRKVAAVGIVVGLVVIGTAFIMCTAFLLAIQQWSEPIIPLLSPPFMENVFPRIGLPSPPNISEVLLNLDNIVFESNGLDVEKRLIENEDEVVGEGHHPSSSRGTPLQGGDAPWRSGCVPLETLWGMEHHSPGHVEEAEMVMRRDMGVPPSAPQIQVLPFAWLWGLAARQDPDTCALSIFLTTYTHGVLSLTFPGKRIDTRIKTTTSNRTSLAGRGSDSNDGQNEGGDVMISLAPDEDVHETRAQTEPSNDDYDVSHGDDNERKKKKENSSAKKVAIVQSDLEGWEEVEKKTETETEDTAQLWVTQGGGWEEVLGWKGNSNGTSSLRLKRVSGQQGSGTGVQGLPVLLSWAHTNLVQALNSNAYREDQHRSQFQDNIFRRQLAGCRGAALAPGASGALYVAVKEGHAIWTVDTKSGTAAVLTGGNGIGRKDGLPAEARFAFPSGLTVSPNGKSIFVADYLNDAIRRIDLEGRGSDGWSGGEEEVPLMTRTSRRAQQLCSLGVTGCSAVTTLAGANRGYNDGPLQGARFNGPRDVAFLPGGGGLDGTGDRLLVLEAGYLRRRLSYHASGWWELPGLGTWTLGAHGDQGQRVRVIDITLGTVTTLAGLSLPGYNNGPGAQAQFNNPLSMSVVPVASSASPSSGTPQTPSDYKVVVADGGNRCLRSIELSTGNVSCLAGAICENDKDVLEEELEYAEGVDSKESNAIVRARFTSDIRGVAHIRSTDTDGTVRTVSDDLVLVVDRHAYAIHVVNMRNGESRTLAKAMRLPNHVKTPMNHERFKRTKKVVGLKKSTSERRSALTRRSTRHSKHRSDGT